MFRKILIYGAALFVTGCYDPDFRYKIEQEQHERGLAAIMTVYDEKCAPADRFPIPYPEGPDPTDQSFCNGIRESYWAVMSDRNLQGFEKYLEPSTR